MTTDVAANVYKRLGVKRIINARGTVTRVGGSLMPPEVVAAMAEAARSYVDLDELAQKCGEVVARITGAEAGLVCAGAAAGLTLGAAACVAGNDPACICRLPDCTGMKNEVIVHRAHRNGYDHSVRAVGVKFIEIGYPHTVPALWELENAITERTAAIFYVFAPWVPHTALPFEQVVAIAKKHNVPTLVDASAVLPPAENLQKFIRQGADLVAISGGKGIMGPQASGILCGRRDLIAAAALHANPNHAIGRPMKVGKEEMVGLVTALELYAERDHEADLRDWRGRAQAVADTLGGLEGVRAEVVHDESHLVPQAVITLTSGRRGPSLADVAARLRAGAPPVYLGGGKSELIVNPHTLQPGEAKVVAARLRDALSA